MSKSIYSAEHKYLIAQLKKARMASGLTQEDISRKLGTSQSFISKIESGLIRIDIVQLKRLAKVYKKDLHLFIKS
jgi:transcriptional regulator with XRE-family HTH domain